MSSISSISTTDRLDSLYAAGLNRANSKKSSTDSTDSSKSTTTDTTSSTNKDSKLTKAYLSASSASNVSGLFNTPSASDTDSVNNKTMASYISYGTGVNTAPTSDELKSYLSDTKKYSDEILNTINSVSDKTSAEDLVKKTKSFVSSYNKLLSTSSKFSSDSGAKRLQKQLAGISSTYSDSLDNIGVSVNKDGSLSVDETKLKKASENNKLQDYWKDSKSSNSFGFFNKAKNITSNIKNDSTYYLSPTIRNDLSSSNTISHTNTNFSTVSSTNRVSKGYINAYCNYTVVGSLLNMMF